MNILDRHDLQSAVWKKLQAHMEFRLHALRSKNDGAFDAIETAAIRGRIGQLKELLALAQAEPVREGSTQADPTGAVREDGS